MRKIDALFQEYGLSHQNMTNKLIHWFCVPAIFFSIVGLLFSIPVGPLPDLMPFLGMFLFSSLCLAVANYIDLTFPGKLWMFSLGIFVLAWFMQFYGHKIEGKKPTFLRDLQFLLIGPAWLMHFIYKKWGFSY